MSWEVVIPFQALKKFATWQGLPLESLAHVKAVVDHLVKIEDIGNADMRPLISRLTTASAGVPAIGCEFSAEAYASSFYGAIHKHVGKTDIRQVKSRPLEADLAGSECPSEQQQRSRVPGQSLSSQPSVSSSAMASTGLSGQDGGAYAGFPRAAWVAGPDAVHLPPQGAPWWAPVGSAPGTAPTHPVACPAPPFQHVGPAGAARAAPVSPQRRSQSPRSGPVEVQAAKPSGPPSDSVAAIGRDVRGQLAAGLRDLKNGRLGDAALRALGWKSYRTGGVGQGRPAGKTAAVNAGDGAPSQAKSQPKGGRGL